MSFDEIPLHYPKFEEEFPGWATLVRTVTEKVLTLSGIQTCLDITKQQLDYWMQKGILPWEDRTSAKWRRFSVLDVFMMAVAAEFKSYGIEISNIAQIMKIETLRRYGQWNEIFVHMINGYDVYLYSDFSGIAGISWTDPQEEAESSSPLRIRVRKDTKFVAAVSLKKIGDELAPKLQMPYFKVKVLPDGRYEFIINDVPLKLESLKEEDMRAKYSGFNETKERGK